MAISPYIPVTPDTYISPLSPDTQFTFASLHDIYPQVLQIDQNDFTSVGMVVSKNGVPIFSIVKGTKDRANDTFSTVLELGTYTVEYQGQYSLIVGNTVLLYDFQITTYTFQVVSNTLPLKKWTITDVINRLFDVAEPIYSNEKPRFRLQGIDDNGNIIPGSLADRLDKIIAPEFAFTQQTLREDLQQIGQVIHAEPRFNIAKDGAGKYYFELIFDEYGQTDESGIWHKPYIQKTVSQVIDSYASRIESNVENLVNQLNKEAGVITEPIAGGAQTVRTETLFARITDGNMYISSRYPIYSISKLEYWNVAANANDFADITPYVFEESEYARLSSYSTTYPTARAYAIYFSQGQRNIKGLNFQLENASGAPGRYAIQNIIQAVGASLPSTDPKEQYPLLAFRLTYTPVYSSRVGQTKTNYKDYPYDAALIYNQQANVIETEYYGENLKGTIARIGNVEMIKTYKLAFYDTVPKAGQMYDKDYYISFVLTQVFPTCFMTTIGLSKDFNRLSAYIGISSEKRYSEISETQAIERNTLWREYCVVGDEIDADTSPSSHMTAFMSGIKRTFNPTGNISENGAKPFTGVYAAGSDYNGNPLPSVMLPVITSAFGNAVSVSWAYADNYSAGDISQYESQNNVSGYWQNAYRYTDIYGRIYYYKFKFYEANPNGQETQAQSLKYPAWDFMSIDSPTYTLRKDNREILQCNYQVDFVSSRKDLIIGSALASFHGWVRNLGDDAYKPRLYIFDRPLNKFIKSVSGSLNIDIDNIVGYDVSIESSGSRLILTAGAFATAGKSWAVVIGQKKGASEQVVDEKGHIVTQQPVSGGVVLIAQNMEISVGQAFPNVYFTPKRKIFKEDVWKDKK